MAFNRKVRLGRGEPQVVNPASWVNLSTFTKCSRQQRIAWQSRLAPIPADG